MEKPDCFKCENRRDLEGDTHSRCTKLKAKVRGSLIAIKHGWFAWPFNYDPRWLESCDSFKAKSD